MNWYGGPEHKLQLYPVQKMKLENFAYIPIEGGGIMERFWLNSRGISIYVHSETPLFVDQNSMQADRMCFTAKQSMPYDTTMENFNFYYQIGFNSDARRSQNHFVNYNVFYKPSTIPNIKLIEKPMWNTWVRYGRNINEKKIRDFISEISQNNFTYSMMIIDDFWEKCYGSMTVDKLKFPNMKSLITEIKTKYTGILFSLWIHPFINKNCNPYYDNAKKSNFFVKSATGSIDTSWWDSTLNDAAYIDFSDPHTKDWFQGKLYELKKETGVDGFKFVAGATSFLPKNAILKNTKIYQPADIIKCYSNIALHFKDTMDITTGLQTQKYGLIIRMNGFNSRWTIDNGLQALIPRLIQINLSGYLFVLPGNF